MARVIFQWQGVKELMDNLQKAGVAIDDKDPAIKSVILVPAKAMIENAKNLAPIGKITTTKHKPGTLRRSLMAAKGPSHQRGIFLVARKRIAPYARYVEFGTSKMTAHPFFRPALFQMGSTYANDIAPGVKQILETAAAANAYHPG